MHQPGIEASIVTDLEVSIVTNQWIIWRSRSCKVLRIQTNKKTLFIIQQSLANGIHPVCENNWFRRIGFLERIQRHRLIDL